MERGFSNLLETEFITVLLYLCIIIMPSVFFYFGLVIGAFKILNIISARRMMGLTITSCYYERE
jgi:hypothetical protein